MKKEKTKEIEEEKEVKKPDYAKQTKFMLTIMIVLLISVFVVYWAVRQNQKINYNGIEFYKEKQGNVMYYKSLLGYVTASGEQIPFILKLRTNPEELAKIPVEGDIHLLDEAIITLSPEIVNCSKTYITMLDMSITLKALGTVASAATTDRDYSIENNLTLADCRNSLNKTVIVFKEGNKTQISRERVIFKNCYIIELDNCQIREGYERFILAYIGGSMIDKNEQNNSIP